MNLFDPAESVMEAIRTFLADTANDFINSGIGYMAEYIADPVKLTKIPHFNELLIGAQGIGASLATLFFYLQILKAFRDLATGEDDPNWAALVGSFAISIGMIFSFPFALTHYIIPIVNDLVSWLGAFDTNVELAGKVVTKISPAGGLAAAAFHIIFIALIFGIGCLVMSIAAMLQFAQLVLGVLFGPIFLASHSNRSGVLQSYFTELTAVLFTKVVHMLVFLFVIWTAAKGTFEMMCLSIAFMIIGALGPHVLRTYLVNSGVGGGTAGAARFVAYRYLFKGFRR